MLYFAMNKKMHMLWHQESSNLAKIECVPHLCKKKPHVVGSNGPGSVRFFGFETKPNHLFIIKTKPNHLLKI